MRWTMQTARVAGLIGGLLLGAACRLEAQAQCTLPELCTGALTTGACGYAGTACMPPPSTGLCAANGVGQCVGTYNCVPPTATVQGVQILAGSGGTFTARLPLDVQAPFNGWAAANFPASVLNVFWYAAATVPDICDGSVPLSLCQFAATTTSGGTVTGADHVSTWLDKTGLTCAGAPYSFTVSARLGTCTQPSCECEMFGGNPNCICDAPTATNLNNLTINVPKSMLPGCVPPPDFCGDQGGAAGGVGSAGGTGDGLKALGSKGNGPDSGAAGTTGGGGGQCKLCLVAGSSSGDGSGCSASAGGGGASCSFGGPGAHFHYGGGGVGGPGFPGSTGVTANPWNTTLGRFWSHDYAERIVMDPDPTHVWLLTRFGSFREFGSLASGTGLVVYQTVTPGDEYRSLYFDTVNLNWQLKGLDGSVEFFLPATAGSPAGMLAGFLDKITDRLYDPANPTAHPPVQAVYNASNQLDHVSFPDGRIERFAYAGGATGKLASLTEVGTDGTTSRTWTFAWNGDDLTSIGRPDLCPGLSAGTSWTFFYDKTLPGYLDQVLLTDCHTTSRVEAEMMYDTSGNVVELWRGDPMFTGPNATDSYQLSFDSPALPSVTTVQALIRRTVVGGANQDTTQTAVYTLAHDPGRHGAAGTRKAQLLSVIGDCPSCGASANSTFAYVDPANPLLPTTVTDGRGTPTSFTYDANGRTLTQVETVQTSPSLVQRETAWTYNASFPAFVSSVTGPFSPPGTAPAGTRATTKAYDAHGNLQTSTATGSEATYPGGAFSLTTAYSNYSPAGLPGLVDPPDVPATTADATTYTFVSGPSNGFLVATRLDPVIGAPPLNAATTFAYDALNRLTDVTDPNGMDTHTTYDPLNRILSVTQGFGTAQPLTTTYAYSTLGDLACVQLAAGNAIAYAYDFAGRLISMARQSSCSATQPLEQTLYALDAVGHRIAEVRQRTVSNSLVTDATTTYAYTTTCHLDSMTAGDPTNPNLQSTTHFAYDCDNNLTSLWAPNHSPTGPPTTMYSYDPLNRLTQVLQPWGGAGGGNAITAYAYDLEDHLASVTDSERNQTTYVTSDRDLLTRQTSPVTGITSSAYNAHGALVQQTDARGVVMARQLDPADRPLSVSYSTDASLTTTYTYDTSPTTGTAPIGRLSSISKGAGATATNIAYTYDLFGRTLQDGALAYTYDLNGNRASIAYPGGVTACYTYDIADRESALSYSTTAGANACQGTTLPIVTSTPSAPTVYLSGGPLQTLHLANGLTETHTFDQRYYPTTISAGTLLNWTYTTDAVGNITTIAPGRTYTYQDVQYFLTNGNGPWGPRAWTYDSIGNRLTENRGTGITDTYTYLTNAASPQGDTPKLKSIALASNAGTELFAYDPAGNTIQQASPTAQVDLAADSSGKLSRLGDDIARTSSKLLYDGRGFLASASNSTTDCGPLLTTPTYNSDGMLYYRQQQSLITGAIPAQTRIFYFAGRPIAQLDNPLATATLTYLTADHLGTPILAESNAGLATWSGGFEPFGRDYSTPSAQQAGMFLRLPGQWDDAAWDNIRDVYYNVNRWYEHQTGRYTQPDPFMTTWNTALYGAPPLIQALPGSGRGPELYFGYAFANPTRVTDPLGLYGTTDCSYYDARCSSTHCTYYCDFGTTWCNRFHHLDNLQWTRCTRQCLQDYDYWYCNPPGCRNCSAVTSCNGKGHSFCYAMCSRDPGKTPVPPRGFGGPGRVRSYP
jgi:YD repeat-containing protein